MKKVLLIAAAAVALSTSAMAADLKMPAKAPPAPPPSPWDVAFGASIASDYIWRGITQSNHRPSVSAYTELRYNSSPTLQWYGGISGSSISFPNQAALELDFYGGVRPTFGPLALDIGFWQYYYPGGQCYSGIAAAPCVAAPIGNFVAKEDWHFWEVFAKGTWTFNDQWAAGFNVWYTPNILNTGADGTFVSGTLKYTAPASMALWAGNVGWYVSGEYGYQQLGTSDAFYGTGPGTTFVAGVDYTDYAMWNVGLGFTYKVFTLDLRYYDTDLSEGDCAVYTSAHTASFGLAPTAYNPAGVKSNWCDARFVAKLSFDLTMGVLK
jgi:uncharacterized protein (TIGR02001 family)